MNFVRIQNDSGAQLTPEGMVILRQLQNNKEAVWVCPE
jgi:hypothetical protein